MPKLAFGFDGKIGEWVAARIPHVGTVDALGPFVAIGVISDTDPPRVLAGAVLHNVVPRYAHAELSFAADEARWATRGVIRGILAVPFEEWKMRRLTMVTPHTNSRAIKLIEGLGFKREGTVRCLFSPRQHGAIYGMLSSEYWSLVARLNRKGVH